MCEKEREREREREKASLPKERKSMFFNKESKKTKWMIIKLNDNISFTMLLHAVDVSPASARRT